MPLKNHYNSIYIYTAILYFSDYSRCFCLFQIPKFSDYEIISLIVLEAVVHGTEWKQIIACNNSLYHQLNLF